MRSSALLPTSNSPWPGGLQEDAGARGCRFGAVVKGRNRFSADCRFDHVLNIGYIDTETGCGLAVDIDGKLFLGTFLFDINVVRTRRSLDDFRDGLGFFASYSGRRPTTDTARSAALPVTISITWSIMGCPERMRPPGSWACRSWRIFLQVLSW